MQSKEQHGEFRIVSRTKLAQPSSLLHRGGGETISIALVYNLTTPYFFVSTYSLRLSRKETCFGPKRLNNPPVDVVLKTFNIEREFIFRNIKRMPSIALISQLWN